MKTRLGQLLRAVGLIGAARAVRRGLQRFLRRVRPVDRAIVDRYLATHAVRKLHIGCGGNTLDGWLNSDYEPALSDVVHLDATGTFPFGDGVFDFVFSEHMIEHVSYGGGLAMLRECHRVMKPGGRIRISTPDLAFLVDLYRTDKSPLQEAYIRWASAEFIRGIPGPDDAFVINNFVRDWGHLFIYDEKTLRASLVAAGFTDVVRCALNESPDAVLRGLENEARMPPGFLALESFTLEATKPGPAAGGP